MQKLTANTITDLPTLMKEIERIRKNGYAVDNEECETGHRCVSVPIYDYTGKAAAAISAFHNTDMLEDQRIETQILPALRKASAELSYRLGYQPE